MRLLCSYAKRVLSGLPLNEDLGIQDNMKTWYGYDKDPRDGYVSPVKLSANLSALIFSLYRPTSLPTRRQRRTRIAHRSARSLSVQLSRVLCQCQMLGEENRVDLNDFGLAPLPAVSST